MGYLTTNKLTNIVDLPIQLPATEVKMGDWIVIASVKIAAPQQLRFRFLNIQMHSSDVDLASITSSNKIYGNLGLAYVALRRDYASGSPGQAGALELLSISALDLVERSTTETVYTTAGRYSWLIANNMQPSSSSSVPTSTEINFRLSVTGQVRLHVDGAQ